MLASSDQPVHTAKSALKITSLYYAAFLSLGLISAALGPSLPILAERAHVQLKQASLLFSAHSFGYLIGALLGGQAYDRRPGHPVMIVSLAFSALLAALVPLMPELALMAAVILLLGAAQASVDVGGNTLLVWLHREKVGSFMNGMHASWGIGSILSPLVISAAILVLGNINWAYGAFAALLLMGAVLLRGQPSPLVPERASGETSRGSNPWPFVIAFLVFFAAFDGAQNAYGGWIYSFAVETKIADAAAASVLTSVYWGALTISRLASIPLALRFKPRSMLIGNISGCILGLSLAVLSNGSSLFVWLATILVGLSVGSFFPTALSFASEVLVITGQFTSLIFVGVSLGGMLLPWLIGQFFETAGPYSAMVIMLADVLICVGIFWILNVLKNKRQLESVQNR